MWNFKELQREKTRILLMRHGDHINNILTPEAIEKCNATGKALRDSGIEISLAYSSPSPWASDTNSETQKGYGKRLNTRTDDGLSYLDRVLDKKEAEALQKITKVATGKGDKRNALIINVELILFPKLIGLMGIAAADCLRGIARWHKGITVLVTPDTIGQIEMALKSLTKKERKMYMPEKFAAECQIAELIFNGYEMTEVNWLEPLAIP